MSITGGVLTQTLRLGPHFAGSGMIYVITPVRMGLLSIVGAERPLLRSVGSQEIVVSYGNRENNRAGTHRPTLYVRRLIAVPRCDAGSRIAGGGRNDWGSHMGSGSPLRGCRV